MKEKRWRSGGACRRFTEEMLRRLSPELLVVEKKMKMKVKGEEGDDASHR
jgi:hypothetical protein